MRRFHKRLGRAFRLAAMEMLGVRNAYDAAAMHRLYSDWIATCRLPDEEIKADAKALRARARELARNNAYVKRYFRLLANNVIGPMGIKLQAQVWTGENPDGRANGAIEAAWKDWASDAVTTDGRHNLRQFEKLILKTWGCDGEVFVRLWRGFEGNRHGLALEAIDADLVDLIYNRQASPGKNEIRLGVEVDKAGRPVGYHVRKIAMSSGMSVMRERYFIPASEVIHLYFCDRVNQTRGVTWVHAAMAPAHMLGAYEDSEAIASRIAASKMGTLEKTGEGIGIGLGDGKKPLTMQAEPGTYEALDEGWHANMLDPQHPTAQFPAFVKQMLRKIASALGVFYNVLANDAEQVTYSTMRSFALIERDDWRGLQQDLIEIWRQPLYRAWLESSMLTGALALPWERFGDFLSVRHRPRGWQWIDPEKEGKAAVLSIENGLGTRTAILAEKGEDIEEVFAELARENELAAAYGISISQKVGDDKKLPKEQWEAEADETEGGDGDGRDRAETLENRPASSPRPTVI
jgi:lambda family phage portal protein